MGAGATEEGLCCVCCVCTGSEGGTTAAKFFLHYNKRSVRGIAICRNRSQKGQPYVTEMLQLLGLNSENPPNGWLTCLIKALAPSAHETRKSVLILDEYGNVPTNMADDAFITHIKTRLRSTCIYAIALTPSVSYADHLLTVNDLEGIGPLEGTYLVR